MLLPRLPQNDRLRCVWAFAARDAAALSRQRGRYLAALQSIARPDSDFDGAGVIFGEFVNNAAAHAPGPVLAELIVDEGAAYLTVEDLGPGVRENTRSAPHPHAVSGRGLALVESLAHEVTIEPRAVIGTIAQAELPVTVDASARERPDAGEAARAAFADYELECWMTRRAERLAQRIARSAPRDLHAFFHAAPGEHVPPHLAESVRALALGIGLGTWPLWVADARWTGRVAAARGLDPAVARRVWSRFFNVLGVNVPVPHRARIRAIAQHALQDGDAAAHAALSPLARRYVEAVDRSVAESRALLHDARGGGMSVAELYDGVLAPAMQETGRQWEAATIGIAHERRRTSATRERIAELRDRPRPHARRLGTIFAACAPGEDHDIGLRMVANLAEDAGWDVAFLGARVPAVQIVAGALAARPDVIALSASLTLTVSALVPLIASLRAHPELGGVPIVVGGGPFAAFRDLHAVVGADATAVDAASALEMFAQHARTLTPLT
ncbi:cobalamin-dependent protein [Vulcanimicrobium alpinum]|uniref:cobalamin-dependent protein n=1 Tax=Vulcanimicrobium alpinum TaxID=3016050 RepID=UPI00295E7936|nr:cobalamin-dependent protein [Vulcanimicrobium alpinum]